jgi:hypothetical protein
LKPNLLGQAAFRLTSVVTPERQGQDYQSIQGERR